MNKKQLRFVATLLAILALGSVLLVACSRPGSPSASAGGNTASGGNTGGNGGSSGGANTVQMGAANFLQPSITITKGSKLTLTDAVAVPHIIQNGSWVNGNAQPGKEAAAPTVSANFNGSDSQDIGPFTTAGTFHLYCTIHSGMNLTVTVK
ncbi:MAG: plastocyanin/azurin family copper-binding protein [Ktedonobacteraceae bacterium]